MQNVVIIYNGRRMAVTILTSVLMIVHTEEIQPILNGFFETIRGGSREEVIEGLHSLFLNEYLLQILDDLIPQFLEDLPDDQRISAVGIVSFLVAFITYFIYLIRKRRQRGGSTSTTKKGSVCIDNLCATVPEEYHVFITVVIELIEYLQTNPIHSPTEFLNILRKMSVKTPRHSGTRRASSGRVSPRFSSSTRVKKRQRNITPRLSSSTRVKHRPLTPRLPRLSPL